MIRSLLDERHLELFPALHRALPASSAIVDEIVAQIPQMMQFLVQAVPSCIAAGPARSARASAPRSA